MCIIENQGIKLTAERSTFSKFLIFFFFFLVLTDLQVNRLEEITWVQLFLHPTMQNVGHPMQTRITIQWRDYGIQTTTRNSLKEVTSLTQKLTRGKRKQKLMKFLCMPLQTRPRYLSVFTLVKYLAFCRLIALILPQCSATVTTMLCDGLYLNSYSSLVHPRAPYSSQCFIYVQQNIKGLQIQT